MLKDANFLCEIGTEEIPAGYIPPAVDNIKKLITEKFNENRIEFKEIAIYATPRRFAILVSKLSDYQKKEEIEIKGPSAESAYDTSKNPTKALQGFIKGNDVVIEDIFVKNTQKGGYVFTRKRLESKATKEIIPGILDNIIRLIPFPKKMRWSNKKLLFPRPVLYFLVLFNNMKIPFKIEGIESSNRTRGYYIQHNSMFEIS